MTFDLQRLSEVKIISAVRKPIHEFLPNFYLHLLSISYRFWDIWFRSISGFDHDLRSLDFTWGQYCFIIRKPIYDFLSNIHWHSFSISHRFRNIRLQSFQASTLTFNPWRSSGVKNFYTIRKAIYDFLFDFYGHHLLSRTVFKIFDFKVFRVWPSPLTSKGHLGSTKLLQFERPYMTSYSTSMDTISLSRTVFDIYIYRYIRLTSFEGLTLTFDP